MEAVIADTGPLLAYLDRKEANHEWARATIEKLTEPLLTCEIVIAEAAFILSRKGQPADMVFSLLAEGVIVLDFDLAGNYREVAALMRAYRSIPMSVADASLVRMSELDRGSVVFTLDRDFLVYRRNGRQRIPLLAPFA